jgi:hypothetical protein
MKFRELDASVEASGPHDFAVRVSAVRQQHFRVHRIPLPTSVTIASAPPVGAGRGNYETVLRQTKTDLFFQEGLDR